MTDNAKACAAKCARDILEKHGQNVTEGLLISMVADEYLRQYGTYDENSRDQIEISLDAFRDLVIQQLKDRSEWHNEHGESGSTSDT